jgi:hypothetical protein
MVNKSAEVHQAENSSGILTAMNSTSGEYKFSVSLPNHFWRCRSIRALLPLTAFSTSTVSVLVAVAPDIVRGVSPSLTCLVRSPIGSG